MLGNPQTSQETVSDLPDPDGLETVGNPPGNQKDVSILNLYFILHYRTKYIHLGQHLSSRRKRLTLTQT